MKKIKYLISLVFLALIVFSACEDYVTEIDPLIDAVEDERLNDAAQVNFLIVGVKSQFAFTMDNLMVIADGLSDQFFFSYDVPNATYPTFEDIDKGEIEFDNNSVDGPFNNLGELRFFSDNLISRLPNIAGLSAAKAQEAKFVGYLYGGLARYYYATYFGLTVDGGGGGVIDNGPFIPANDMFDLAADKLKLALAEAGTAWETALVNSLLARLYLFKGDNATAATYAANGFVNGDADFTADYNDISNNYYWVQAGVGRTQFVCDTRFNDYVVADPAEAARIPLGTLTGTSGTTYYQQKKFADKGDPLPHMTWQENNLMRAELKVRGAGSGDALALVNEVRASHNLSALSAVDIDVIYTERDKELFCTGVRLPDQRRFTGKWHLGAGKWKYFPITQGERNNNPNF